MIAPKTTLGKKLGAGHFGKVYLANDPVHGEVAVKVIERDTSKPPAKWDEQKDRFLKEAQNLAKATHRNIVRVFHLEEADGGDSVRICMELCQGGSLQGAYDAGPMNLLQVRNVGSQVLLGLGALHAREMLHRDLKPGNILVDEHGKIRIGDFGLVTDDLILGYADVGGYIYVDHLAYEVWHGNGTSEKSDVWAFGMTMFRLLHGHDWYERAPKPRGEIVNGGFADTLEWLPHIPKRWRRVIREMLRDDTAARLQNVSAVQAKFASLPVAPVWDCKVATDRVVWERLKKGRRIVVEWLQHSATRHEWSAQSEPTTTGKTRRLAGSAGVIGRRLALKQLEDFFAGSS